MTGGVSRGKTLERTCTYETRIPVSNARRDPMWLADDSVGICELNGCTCVRELGETCPEFDQEVEFLEDPSNLAIAHEGEDDYAWEYK